MTFLKYIGEFFLFRWLFDKFRKPTTEHDSHTEVSGVSINGNSEYQNGNLDEEIALEDVVTDVSNNLIDDSDNFEELDDLDIFMRNNRSCLHYGDYDGDYHSSGRHEFQNDWNSGRYSQSYDDFHDEQDDYDMMDDDF